MTKHVRDLSKKEAEEHRAKRREIYARTRERQIEYVQAYKARKINPAEARPAKRPIYNVTDYAEEWAFLTEAGMLSTDIIDRSTPSKAWFKKHITPLVKFANCPGCGRKYLVARSRTILICGRDCPKHNYNEAYHIPRGSRKQLEVSHG